MFPFYDNLNVRVKNEGELPVKMGYSTVAPGEQADVSSRHLTAPLLMNAERRGVKYDCIVIGGKCYDLVERKKYTPGPAEKLPEPEAVEEVEVVEEAEAVEVEEEVEEEEVEEAVEVEVEEEEVAVEVEEEKDLDKMSKVELVEVAKELGVSYSGLNKDPLIDAIKEARE